LISPGDVLLAWSGTPGTSFGVHIWNGPAGILNQHIFLVDLDEMRITKSWFMRAVNSRLSSLIDQAHGGVGLKHVTRRMVDDLEIPLPSLCEQRRITAILDQADDLRRKRRAALERLNRFASAIFDHMFVEAKQNRANFDAKTLGELCSLIRDGTHKTPTYVERGVPFVTVKNIANGVLDLKETKFISEQEHRDLTRRVAPMQGDILVSKDGTIGIPCPVLANDIFSIFVSVALLRPKPDLVDQSFLTAQLRTAPVQKQIQERSKGIAIRHLHLEDFRELRIVTPNLALQRAFAARVAQIDKLSSVPTLIEQSQLVGRNGLGHDDRLQRK